MCTIVCKCCGHSGDFKQFCFSDMGRDLPTSMFRCPQCKLQIQQKVTRTWDNRFDKKVVVMRPGVKKPEAA